MSTGPATPSTPTPVFLSKARAAVFAVLAMAGVVLIGFEAVRHAGSIPWPHIGPVTPADFEPLSVLDGSFFPTAPNAVGVKATPGDPAPAPLGLFRLDASTSRSNRPIQWQVDGPGSLKLRTYTPDDAPGHSLAEAEATDYGTYSFHGTSIGILKGLPATHTRTKTFTLTAPAPPPDPGPKPDPNPPAPPTPTPGPPPTPDKPAPIAGDGLRVLIVYESADLSKYPKDQLAILYDQSFRDYLASACVKVNGQPDWRIYDKDTDTANESDTWKAAMGRQHPTLPWIVVSNGKTGFEGPLPGNAADTKALVQKYEVKP